MKLRIYIMTALIFMSCSVTAQAETKSELADALIAAMPQEYQTEGVDQDELLRLTQLNPGKKDTLSGILGEYSHCVTPLINQASFELLHRVAMSLSEDQIKSLTSFYSGPEFAPFASLSDKTDAGQVLNEAEQKYMDNMMASYPMTEFYDAMMEQQGAAATGEKFVGQVTQCSVAKKAALVREKLKFN